MSRVGVWGAGREGLAAVTFLRDAGHQVLLVDDADLERPVGLPTDVAFLVGDPGYEALAETEFVVASPGISRSHHRRLDLASAGVPVTTGSSIWMESYANTTIGVTGTKGKSTTSVMITELLRVAGVPTQLAGNIGIPLIGSDPAVPATVAELSSYQCAYLKRSPRIAVITNLYQDHLPWHGDVETYHRDKARIFDRGAEVLVSTVSVGNRLRELGITLPPSAVFLDETELTKPSEDLVLPTRGAYRHNIGNWRLAIAVAELRIGRKLARAELQAAAEAFVPLPHRLEVVSHAFGRTWIDDTLSTTPQSTAAAIAAIDGPIVVIVGGADRGVDYAPLTDALIEHASRLVVIATPDSGGRSVAAYRAMGLGPVFDADSLDAAVRLAARVGTEGSSVLLAPAAPSHNAYRDFEAKSAAFVAAISLVPKDLPIILMS